MKRTVLLLWLVNSILIAGAYGIHRLRFTQSIGISAWLQIETAAVQEQLNETEFRYRRKFIGAGRVLAESFILGILSLNSLNECIESLISSPKDTSLTCLCTIMTIIGGTLEFYLVRGIVVRFSFVLRSVTWNDVILQDDVEINEYFLKINEIVENPLLSTKSRFLLLNLIQYKENQWTSTSVTRDLLIVGTTKSK